MADTIREASAPALRLVAESAPMPTRVRSYSKINLGLAIGRPRPDGFHSLATLYQTLALHDLLTVSAHPSPETHIRITSNDHHVPTDARNTVWKMVEKTLAALHLTADAAIHIQKNLPIQGGMGAGSANAAAALIGLERQLGLDLPQSRRLDLAAQVGSDVPLFLVGGSVLGADRGQAVEAVPDITLDGQTVIPCVVALPRIGVSTPTAFREWDRRFQSDLHNPPIIDTLEQLSRTYASVFREAESSREGESKSGASGIFPIQGYQATSDSRPEKQHGLLREQLHGDPPKEDESGLAIDLDANLDASLAGNSLLALVRTGSENHLENDFETVVFPQHPLLRDIKRHLMGASESSDRAIYAALSGSGSALFGLYRTQADATAAQHRLQQQGVQAIVTATMPRPLYWSNMFAD